MEFSRIFELKLEYPLRWWGAEATTSKKGLLKFFVEMKSVLLGYWVSALDITFTHLKPIRSRRNSVENSAPVWTHMSYKFFLAKTLSPENASASIPLHNPCQNLQEPFTSQTQWIPHFLKLSMNILWLPLQFMPHYAIRNLELREILSSLDTLNLQKSFVLNCTASRITNSSMRDHSKGT